MPQIDYEVRAAVLIILFLPHKQQFTLTPRLVLYALEAGECLFCVQANPSDLKMPPDYLSFRDSHDVKTITPDYSRYTHLPLPDVPVSRLLPTAQFHLLSRDPTDIFHFLY